MKLLMRLAALFVRSREAGTRLDALRALIDQRVDGDRQPGQKVIYATPHPRLRMGRRLLRGGFERLEA